MVTWRVACPQVVMDSRGREKFLHVHGAGSFHGCNIAVTFLEEGSRIDKYTMDIVGTWTPMTQGE